MPDESMARVSYSLEGFRTVDDEADTGQLAGQFEIAGTVALSLGQSAIDLGGKSFTLETHDGRCLETRAKVGGPVSWRWEIVASGPKGLRPC